VKSILLLIFIALVLSGSFSLQSQIGTNAPAQPTKHKPRPLTETEANEVRSQNLDPTGMTIDADLPITRLLTAEELQELESKGIDSSALKGKPVTVSSDQEGAALQELISKAQQAKATPTPVDLKNAYVWMDNFMGMTNASIMANVISMKSDTLRFQLAGKDYDYSGHYTVMLDKPRVHKNPYFGLGSPAKAKLVILENVGTESFPLTDATIWEKSKGFIDLTASDKEWVHSGTYTIQKE
jgi:hypothetical protein